MKFKNHVTLVTCAGQGIGRSIATRLAHEEATVVVNGVNEKRITDVVGAIANAGKSAFPLKFDVADTLAVKKSIKKIVEEYGGIHILVNNAIARGNHLCFPSK